jgi:hypothetical protein
MDHKMGVMDHKMGVMDHKMGMMDHKMGITYPQVVNFFIFYGLSASKMTMLVSKFYK